MKNPNIKKTLKKFLFISPKPIDSYLYKSIDSLIFPGKQDFISFLDEQNYEKCVDYAKKIILRLHYESRFLPPTRLFYNLLDMETKLKPKVTQGFIGRDHFVHLVHLYLLGIYIFFYHKGINNQIKNQFISIRRHWNARNNLKADSSFSQLNSIEDFIQTWKIFVFYHDIGYPWQILSLSKHISSPKEYDEKVFPFIKPFQKLSKSIIKDISLKTISKLIALTHLWTINGQENFGEVEWPIIIDRKIASKNTNIIREYNDEEKVLFINKWSKAIKLPNIANIPNMYGARSLTAILSPQTILAILKSYKDDKIIAMTYFDKNDNLNKQLYVADTETKKSIVNCDLYKMAFEEIEVPSKRYYWTYYADDPHSQYNQFVLQLLDNNTDSNRQFLEIAQYIINCTAMPLRLITNDGEFRELSFSIYMQLYDMLGYFNDADHILKADVLFENSYKAEKNLKNNLSKEISNIVQLSIDNFIKEKGSKGIDDIFNEHQNQSIKFIITSNWKSINALAMEIERKIGQQMRSDVHNRSNVSTIFKKIRDKLEPFNCESQIFDSDDKFDLKFDVLKNELSMQYLQEKIFENGLANIDIVLKYKPPYAPERYFDHGLISAITLLELQKLAQKFSTSLVTHPGDRATIVEKILRLSLCAGSVADDNSSVYESVELINTAFYSIILHNIKPNNFPNIGDRNFRTNINIDPFSYLAILSDNLQEWERDRIINQAFFNLPNSIYSDAYDIAIDHNTLYITEIGDNIDIDRRKNDLSKHLSSILRDAGQLIKVSLTEWKGNRPQHI